VAVGNSKAISISLTNSAPSGGPNLTLSAASVSGSAFTVQSPALPRTLAAGQSSSIVVVFKPAAGGTDTGQLSVTIQGTNQPALVSLSGTGFEAAGLSVTPAAINFGSVPVGASEEKTGSLTASDADVTISNAKLSGSGYSLNGIVFPVTVSAGTSVPFTVTFAPQSSSGTTGNISFISDAASSPTVLSLTGTGSQPVQHSVQLSWNASSSHILGYNVYRSTQLDGSYVRLNSSLISNLTFTDFTVQSSTTYYYAATLVDSNNVESAHSNIATATVP
jgi:hypothetical protein